MLTKQSKPSIVCHITRRKHLYYEYSKLPRFTLQKSRKNATNTLLNHDTSTLQTLYSYSTPLSHGRPASFWNGSPFSSIPVDLFFSPSTPAIASLGLMPVFLKYCQSPIEMNAASVEIRLRQQSATNHIMALKLISSFKGTRTGLTLGVHPGGLEPS